MDGDGRGDRARPAPGGAPPLPAGPPRTARSRCRPRAHAGAGRAGHAGARRQRSPDGAAACSISTRRPPASPGGTGTYAFLVGVGFVDGDAFEVRQYFMRDLDEEPALLAALEALLSAVRRVRHLQRHRLRPAAARDALRARPATLARRSLPPRPPRPRPAALERAAPRLPARHGRAETCSAFTGTTTCRAR